MRKSAIVSALWIACATAVSVSGCRGAGDAKGGCKSDQDCKGDRVCTAGQCADPPARAEAKSSAEARGGRAALASAEAGAPSAASSSPAPRGEWTALRDEALTLLQRWVAAQNAGNAADYLALYDAASFTGIRRTADGSAVHLAFDAWRAERSKMLSAKPTVAADQPSVVGRRRDPSLGEGMLRVTFVQRWRSSAYADHGPKVLKLSGRPLRIVYEELVSSASGWADADSKATVVDGTALTSPVTLRLTAALPKDAESPGVLSLTATDAKGARVVVPLGKHLGLAASYAPEPAGAGFLYKATAWYAGAGDDFNVARDGAGVTVKSRWLQEVMEEEQGKVPDHGPFVDLARLTLAPGAEVVAR